MKSAQVPDHTAVRVALWRALHAAVDARPLVLEDEIGLKLVDAGSDWRARPDMSPDWTRGYRASIVARARFIEDLVLEKVRQGITQYVVLGAGLDTFAQRKPEAAAKLRIFEIDQPETQAWKQKRLRKLGYPESEQLRFVPVDFEAGDSWAEKLVAHGFDPSKPAVFASTGVSMYLTREANLATLKQIAAFAPGSVFALGFILTLDLIEPAERAGHEVVYERARAAGTPFISFFRPEDLQALAREAGFKKAMHISRADLIERYFRGRTDGLVPASGEEILIASA